MTSDAGDYIGQGQTWTHGPQTDKLTPGAARRSCASTYQRRGLVGRQLRRAARPAAHPGTTYENAHRYPFNDNSPGLDVGGYGRGCNESTSRFTVDQLAFDPDGTLRTFQVTFEQHCEHAQPALRGTWTFHAA